MATKTTRTCDRCGTKVNQQDKPSRITVRSPHVSVRRVYIGTDLNDGRIKDLCGGGSRALEDWLSRDNTVSPGYPPVGMRENCPHHVPCAGPCPDGHLVKVR